jgi:tetratricopeptide (TPR) repeat protein
MSQVDLDSNPNKLALNHYKIAASAMQINDHANAIEHFDECLVLNPPAEIAMAVWFNLGTAIIRKYRFPQRAGDTISDEEYKWHECVMKCFSKVVEVYDQAVDSRPDVKNSFQTYSRAKDNLYRMPVYGLVFTDARGNTKQRDFEKLKRMPDPPIRSLQLYPPKTE